MTENDTRQAHDESGDFKGRNLTAFSERFVHINQRGSGATRDLPHLHVSTAAGSGCSSSPDQKYCATAT